MLKVCPDCGAKYPADVSTCANDGSLLVDQQPNEDPLIGKIIDDKYRIVSKLGGGGFGAVYRAEHKMMNRTVALKVLHHHLLDGEARNQFLVRFQREARTASKIEHPNAITIFDFGIFEGMPYLVMQYVEGRTLKQVIGSHGALSIERVVSIIEQVSSAIQEAHDIGIVHRDLKPDNIILAAAKDGSERAIVLDFGIAKIVNDDKSADSMQLTQTGTITGTPQYLSPEQAKQGEIDARSDIYSLGIITYEMLCGQVPFTADSVISVLMKHMSEVPPRFSEIGKSSKVSPALEEVVFAALEKEPKNRPQSVRDFARRLSEAAGIAPGSTTSSASLVDTPEIPNKITERAAGGARPGHKSAAAVIVAAGAAVVGAFFYLSNGEPSVPERRATTQIEPQSFEAGPSPAAVPDWLQPVPDEPPAGADESQAPAWEAVMREAEAERDSKNWKRAAGLFGQAIDLGNESAEARFKRGDALLSAGDLLGAASSFRAAAEKDPKHEQALANLGYVYGELGDLQASLDAYQKALEISPEKAVLHNNVGFTHFRMNKLRDAKIAYGKCIKLDPSFTRCIYNLADVYKAEKEFDKVAALYGVALKREPDNAAARFSLGETLEILGKRNQAVEEYRRALKLDPGLTAAKQKLSALGAG